MFKDKIKKCIENKPKTSIALIVLSILGSISSKILLDKIETKTTNINIYTYIINSLSENSIMELLLNKDIEQKPDTIINLDEADDLEMAYRYIIDNINLKSNEYIDISIQKCKDSILINYIFNQEYSEYLRQKGITDYELFSLANNIGELSLMLTDNMEKNLGILVPIDIKVYDSDGFLFIHVRGNELKALNSMRPALTTDEI